MKNKLLLILFSLLLIPLHITASNGNEPDDKEISFAQPGSELKLNSRIKVGLKGSFQRSTEGYNNEGTKVTFSMGDIYYRFSQSAYLRYSAVEDIKFADSKWNMKVGGGIDLLQETWKPSDENLDSQTGSGLALNFKTGFYTRNLLGKKLSLGATLKFQADLTGEPDQGKFASMDRQHALGVGLNFGGKLNDNFGYRAKVDYWNTFSRSEDIQISSNETKSVDIDNGNYINLRAGLNYKIDWPECGKLGVGVNLNYWNKSKNCFDGNEQDNSDANLLSISPSIRFSFSDTPITLGLAAESIGEYGTRNGIISLSGKNTQKPSVAARLFAGFRF